MPVVLSPQAEEDFADILQFTLETWGETQMYAYRVILDQALSTLQQHPLIGHPRPELSPTHRVFPAGRHIIVYRPGDAAVFVSRILHGRMDLKRHV